MTFGYLLSKYKTVLFAETRSFGVSVSLLAIHRGEWGVGGGGVDNTTYKEFCQLYVNVLKTKNIVILEKAWLYPKHIYTKKVMCTNSSTHKYLAVVFDNKLCWNKNIIVQCNVFQPYPSVTTLPILNSSWIWWMSMFAITDAGEESK